MFSSVAGGQPLLSQMKETAENRREMVILSHNDSSQRTPFWGAYGAGVDIIEADVRLRGTDVVAAHDRIGVRRAPLVSELYLEPVARVGKAAWGLKIMFDLKEAEVMPILAELLGRYPETFARGRVEVIISGERPAPDNFSSYPDYIHFDGNPGREYSPEALEKIWMISDDISAYTRWNGKGSIAARQKAALMKVVDDAHALGKRVRFWGTVDNVNTWSTLFDMGIDVTGTDYPARCTQFFDALYRTNYVFPGLLPVYVPTGGSDGKEGGMKNVIVIVGDGMGPAHIAAAETANRGALSMLGIDNMGFMRNPSLDSHITDSAAAATAMFTGEKTANNMLSTGPDSLPVPNTAEMFAARGIRTGVVSTGDVTDATSAANWAHSPDRNDAEFIAGQLSVSGLSLLAGPGREAFDKRADGRDVLREMRERGYAVTFSADSIALSGDRVVCLDDVKFSGYLDPSRADILAPVMRDAIRQLNGPEGFFLVFESARIDYASHIGDLRRAVVETIALDAAVAEALRFADADGATLVIVTGDHETGGLALTAGDRSRGYVAGQFSSDDHTAAFVPVFAYGVGAHLFRGFYENTDLLKKIVSLYELDRP